MDQNHVTAWLSACDDDYLSEHGVNRETILADMIAHEERNTAQCHAFVDWFLDRLRTVVNVEGDLFVASAVAAWEGKEGGGGGGGDGGDDDDILDETTIRNEA